MANRENQKVHLILSGSAFPNMYWLVFGRLLSLANSFADIFDSLGLPCFSAMHFNVSFSSSRSVHLQFHSSPILNPVSFKAWGVIDTFLLVSAIRAAISF